MDAEKIAELRKLHEAATPGPWKATDTGHYAFRYEGDERIDEPAWYVDEALQLGDGECPYFTKADAQLVAEMRSDLPELLDLAERALAAVASPPNKPSPFPPENEIETALHARIAALEAENAALLARNKRLDDCVSKWNRNFDALYTAFNRAESNESVATATRLFLKDPERLMELERTDDDS